jgi:hypothetical protein
VVSHDEPSLGESLYDLPGGITEIGALSYTASMFTAFAWANKLDENLTS